MLIQLAERRRSLLLLVVLYASLTAEATLGETASRVSREAAAYRGPLDVVLLQNEQLCVTANELSNSVSLIDLASGTVLDEVECAARPAGLAAIGASEFLVTCRDLGVVERFDVAEGKLRRRASFEVGFDPIGVTVDARQQRAFVGLNATGEVAVLDLKTNVVARRFSTGNWPRSLAVSPDGTRLAVGLSGDSSIAIHDADSGELLYDEPLSGGINIGHLACSNDGKQVYFPWMVYRSNPITPSNIQRGWVLASRVARVRLDGPSYREAISLDVPRMAVADPHGLAITPDETRMVVSSSGTHELLVYRLRDLPFIGEGGPGDLIDRRLLADQDLFFRIPVGGRPMAVRSFNLHDAKQQVLVANHTLDCLQIVDLESREVAQSISLGPTPTDPQQQQVHQGLEIFYDARRSLDQWYSCHSCHLDGGTNAKAMDTWNDGTELTSKSVLPLVGVTQTGPWTWHGWQNDLHESLQNSFTSTMQGKSADEDDIVALAAYLDSLKPPPNPFRTANQQLSAAAMRGKLLFESAEVGCSQCHAGERFSDGLIHDVGLGSESDKYEGYNTPSLIGAYRKVRYLHDGRAKTLERVLTKYHRSDEIGGGQELDDSQIADLIEYIKSL
ncbi:MAG: hypothetical protein R3C53_10575 [Pirellulaceae bacterium]